MVQKKKKTAVRTKAELGRKLNPERKKELEKAASRPKPAPMAEEVEQELEFTVRECDLEQVDEGYQQMLEELALDRTKYKDLAETNEKLRKDTDALLQGMMADIGYNRINLPGDGKLVVKECRGRSGSTVSVPKLLEQGVDPDVIRKATVPGKAYYYVKVEERTEKEQEEYDRRRLAEAARATGGRQ